MEAAARVALYLSLFLSLSLSLSLSVGILFISRFLAEKEREGYWWWG